jgi:hypothetical protein
MKLASPEALKLSGTREQSPESFDCYHPRRSLVLGLTVCPDCGELWEPMELPVIGQDEG